MMIHCQILESYSDELLEAIIADLGKQNLSNYRDHETRWKAERLTAARQERKNRKGRPCSPKR